MTTRQEDARNKIIAILLLMRCVRVVPTTNNNSYNTRTGAHWCILVHTRFLGAMAEILYTLEGELGGGGGGGGGQESVPKVAEGMVSHLALLARVDQPTVAAAAAASKSAVEGAAPSAPSSPGSARVVLTACEALDEVCRCHGRDIVTKAEQGKQQADLWVCRLLGSATTTSRGGVSSAGMGSESGEGMGENEKENESQSSLALTRAGMRLLLAGPAAHWHQVCDIIGV